MTRDRLARIENWALGIVSRVQQASKLEDARVELKRDWPMPEKAARRLAGHANAAFGAEVLWLIGVDETDGVVGAKGEDFASWWAATASQFDGIHPDVTHLVLDVSGKQVSGLLFDTARAPFVVKNTAHGQPAAGPVSLEVPWREGTSVRSARRSDLIRVLSPVSAIPDIEVLGGYGSLRVQQPNRHGDREKYALYFSIDCYLSPKTERRIVIPFHRCSCTVQAGEEQVTLDVTVRYSWRFSTQGSTPDTVTMQRTESELIADGPGQCDVIASFDFDTPPEFLIDKKLTLRIHLSVIDAPIPAVLELEAIPKEKGDRLGAWAIALPDRWRRP